MGHALVAANLPGVDPVQKVSIIPRGVGALGYTMQRPTEDRFLLAASELKNRIAVLMGGRASERLIFDGDVSTGAADDLQRATEIAVEMVTKYGMDAKVGQRTYAPRPQSFLPAMQDTVVSAAEATGREIDLAVRDLVEAGDACARAILEKRRADLDAGRRAADRKGDADGGGICAAASGCRRERTACRAEDLFDRLLDLMPINSAVRRRDYRLSLRSQDIVEMWEASSWDLRRRKEGRSGEAKSFASLRKEMVERNIAARGVRDELVLEAMRKVPRELFLPKELREFAYEDSPLPIAGEQTISQPYIVAFMAEALMLKGGEKVLEIGAGSGYAAACSRRSRPMSTRSNVSASSRTRPRRHWPNSATTMSMSCMATAPEGWPEHASV